VDFILAQSSSSCSVIESPTFNHTHRGENSQARACVGLPHPRQARYYWALSAGAEFAPNHTILFGGSQLIDRISRCLSILLTALLVAVSINAQSQETGKPKYEALLERVKAGDTTVSFKDLRMAYTESHGYAPYGGDDTHKSMLAALRDKDYDKALGYAGTILKEKYVDIFAHLVSSLAYGELKNAERASYHRGIVDGLIQSILKTGDGKSTETAYVVIATDEEYALFNLLGLKAVSQSLVHDDKGHSYDKMDAVDRKTNQPTTYYFNIDIPFNWLSKSLKK
jgi:hypothetical protein